MAQIYSGLLGDFDSLNVRDTANALFTFDANNIAAHGLDVSAAVSDTTHGILVGTGTTAATKDDHTIETLIADGAGAGQLEYGAMVVSGSNAVSGGYRVSLSRQFDNDSGSTITVRECGVAIICRDTGAATKHVLIIRDLQTQGILTGTVKIFKYHLDFLV